MPVHRIPHDIHNPGALDALIAELEQQGERLVGAPTLAAGEWIVATTVAPKRETRREAR